MRREHSVVHPQARKPVAISLNPDPTLHGLRSQPRRTALALDDRRLHTVKSHKHSRAKGVRPCSFVTFHPSNK